MPSFKATVRVFRKGSMLNPEEVQVQKALQTLGFENFKKVRMGRCIELVAEASDEHELRSRINNEFRNAEFINPVSEVFEVVAVTSHP